MNTKCCSYLFQDAQSAKLEKADILEMTVRHLQNLQQQQNRAEAESKPRPRPEEGRNVMARITPIQVDASRLQPAILSRDRDRFQAGFRECAKEVTRALNTVHPGVKERLREHLHSCLQRLQTQPPAMWRPW